MATTSDITVLLTRPEAASLRYADELRALFPWIRIVISPVLDIVPVDEPSGAAKQAECVVFTSVHAVAAAGAGEGRRAYAVGPRTGQAAREAGFDVIEGPGDAAGLIPLLEAANEPLLHVRGQHVAAELPCASVVVYDQLARSLNSDARALLAGPSPVVVPVFSPRSARLLSPELNDALAPLSLVAISAAAVPDVTVPCDIHILPQPNASEMTKHIGKLVQKRNNHAHGGLSR